ncbi:MAG TPA: YueI family protein [Virgibacillus sp.]|nr:YueI family protein [Virgibacillus sp.]
MTRKNVEDYLTEGMYGVRRPKEAEREHYLGTLRERIVIVLSKGQVMTDNSLAELEEAIRAYPDATLLINGNIAYRFYKKEKDIADKHNIPYTVITNEENDTDIGAVLTCDYAIDKEDIFIQHEEKTETEPEQGDHKSFFMKIKDWFSS